MILLVRRGIGCAHSALRCGVVDRVRVERTRRRRERRRGGERSRGELGRVVENHSEPGGGVGDDGGVRRCAARVSYARASSFGGGREGNVRGISLENSKSIPATSGGFHGGSSEILIFFKEKEIGFKPRRVATSDSKSAYLSRLGGSTVDAFERPRPSAERPDPPKGVSLWYWIAPFASADSFPFIAAIAKLETRRNVRRAESHTILHVLAHSTFSMPMEAREAHVHALSLGGLGLGVFLPLNQRTMSVPTITSCNTNCA